MAPSKTKTKNQKKEKYLMKPETFVKMLNYLTLVFGIIVFVVSFIAIYQALLSDYTRYDAIIRVSDQAFCFCVGVVLSVCIAIIVLLSSNLATDYIKTKNVKFLNKDISYISDDHGNISIAQVFPAPTWLWLSDLGENRILSYEEVEFSSDLSLSAISDNPKVKRIEYYVTISTGGTPERLLALHNSELFKKHGKKWLYYLMYEFNENWSKELAKLYNPLDKEQQQKFWDLVNSFLSPILLPLQAELKSASFSLN